ncbi:hypothetical protein ACWEK5_41660 [Rhodococcus koreensis]
MVLADRNFASQALLAAVRDTGAHLLVRVKNGRNLCPGWARSRSVSCAARSPSQPARDRAARPTSW